MKSCFIIKWPNHHTVSLTIICMIGNPGSKFKMKEQEMKKKGKKELRKKKPPPGSSASTPSRSLASYSVL